MLDGSFFSYKLGKSGIAHNYFRLADTGRFTSKSKPGKRETRSRVWGSAMLRLPKTWLAVLPRGTMELQLLPYLRRPAITSGEEWTAERKGLTSSPVSRFWLRYIAAESYFWSTQQAYVATAPECADAQIP